MERTEQPQALDHPIDDDGYDHTDSDDDNDNIHPHCRGPRKKNRWELWYRYIRATQDIYNTRNVFIAKSGTGTGSSHGTCGR